MSDSGEWREVKRATTPKNKIVISPKENGSRERTDSFGEEIEVPLKTHVGKAAHREQKLPWSASKRRERNERIEKRTVQRNASKPSP